MSWLHSIDAAVFHFINGTLSNPIFDEVMPFLSGNFFFIPALLLIGVALIWKGGKRGRIFLLLILLVVALGDGWICNTIKKAVARPRPFYEFPSAHLLVGKGKAFSMPSSHAANWFAATTVAFIFYRRSWRFMVPLGLLVSFSRVYNGAHYPSDILVSAILGTGYAIAFVWLANSIWQFIGQRWFPLWWKISPSLINPNPPIDPQNSAFRVPPSAFDSHFLRLGYILIFALLAFRLFYLASPAIELSEDEAYQWIWSKHLALSYFSKPPLIAYAQFLGTTIWGDTEFGVRFFSPAIAAILSLLLLRFLTREINARVGLALVAILTATPLAAVGSILMTIDPLSVLFWTAAMLVGWRAVQPDGTTRHWLWVGLWMGLGFLSKYTNLFQLLCWLIFFLLWPPARKHLRRSGPYLALLLVAISLTPVLLWNSQHGWATLDHIANNGGLGNDWHPTLRYAIDFLINESLLLNPIFFIGMLAGVAQVFNLLYRRFSTCRMSPVRGGAGFKPAIQQVKNLRYDSVTKSGLNIFLFSMGAPLFLFYFAYSFHSRILPNWIAPSIVPLFCLMTIYFHSQWPTHRRILKPLFIAGLTLGFPMIAPLHETDLIPKFLKRTLPAQADPLRRVRNWRETSRAVERAREKLATEGKPTFIIGDHYGITGEISFYLPEAQRQIRENPIVFFRSSSHPKNQFYFWPGYESRTGQNAIYVQQVDLPKLPNGWIGKWLRGGKDLTAAAPKPNPSAPEILEQFASVTDLGVMEIFYGERVFRRIQLFECRNLRDAPR